MSTQCIIYHQVRFYITVCYVNNNLGKWNNPSIIGQCIPPAYGFIIEKINNTRAVLFGGRETDDDAKDTRTNNIYILTISISTVVC